jgi:hypothetical protein
MRIVVRASSSEVDQSNLKMLKKSQELYRLGKIHFRGTSRIHAETPMVGDQMGMRLGNSNTQLSGRRCLGIGPKWHSIERGKTHGNLEPGRKRADAFHYFSQEARTILEGTAIPSGACMRTEKLMTEISMAVFYVDEIKPQLPSSAGGAMKVPNDSGDLLVSEYRRIRRHPKSGIEYGVVIENLWLRPIMDVGTTEAARMGELQSDNGFIIPSSCLPIGLKQRNAQGRKTRKSMWRKHELIGIGPALV